jgi:hypothetical protein
VELIKDKKRIEMKMNKMFPMWLLGLVILISCGKPNDPELLIPPDISGGYAIVSRFETSAYAQDLIKKDSLLFISQGEGGLMIVNIADPENPKTVSITTDGVKGYSTRITMKDSVVYLAAGTFGINVVDVANPLLPIVTASNVSLKPAQNSYILGNFMYTAVSELGVEISDITYPTYPDIRGLVGTTGFANDVFVTSDTSSLIAACGEMGFTLIDISELVQGYGVFHEIGWCDTPGYAEALTIIEEDSLAFMACGTSGLQIIDYADTNNIHIVGNFDASGYAKDLIYKNQKIYMTTELSGLQIINVADVTNPYLIGSVETAFAKGIDMDEKYIYIADEEEGLIIISVPE